VLRARFAMRNAYGGGHTRVLPFLTDSWTLPHLWFGAGGAISGFRMRNERGRKSIFALGASRRMLFGL
jgi:hypothetical protein